MAYARSRNPAADVLEKPSDEFPGFLVLVAVDVSAEAKQIAGMARHSDAFEIAKCAARSGQVEVAERGLQTFQHRAGVAGNGQRPGIGESRRSDRAQAVDRSEDDV